MKTVGKTLVGVGATILLGHYFSDKISNFHEIANDVCDTVFTGTHLVSKFALGAIGLGAGIWAGDADTVQQKAASRKLDV